VSSLVALIGLPVVSRTTAETVGTLIAPVLDVNARRVVAWQVVKGRHPLVVENEHLAGIGQAAAMLDEEASLREASEPEEVETVKGSHILLGARVLTDAGDVLGTIEDAEVDSDSGAVAFVRTSGGDVSADRLRGFGSYALVVAAL
jgi:uncharacterized protein YrrD